MHLTHEEVEQIRQAMRDEFGPLTDIVLYASRFQTPHAYYCAVLDGSPDATALKWDDDEYTGPVIGLFGVYRDSASGLIVLDDAE